MRRAAALLLAFLLLLAPPLRADGSCPTDALLKTLDRSNPKLVAALRTGYKLDADASGVVIANSINPRLGGSRIGPYTVRARIAAATGSAATGPMDLVVTLNTTITFLDARGRKTNVVADAVAVRETLDSFLVQAAR